MKQSDPRLYLYKYNNSYAHQLTASYKPQEMVPMRKVTLGKVQKKTKYTLPAKLCKEYFLFIKLVTGSDHYQ